MSYLDFKRNEWIVDIDGEFLVPERVQIFVNGLALVHGLAPMEELDVGVRRAAGVLGGKVVALFQVDVKDKGRMVFQFSELFVFRNCDGELLLDLCIISDVEQSISVVNDSMIVIN